MIVGCHDGTLNAYGLRDREPTKAATQAKNGPCMTQSAEHNQELPTPDASYQQWEYSVLSTPPPGPVQVYLTYFRTDGMERHIFNAQDYKDGSQRLWPQKVAEMGLAGWELVFVDQAGSYYFRRPLR